MKTLSCRREQVARLFVLFLFILGIIICVAGGFPLLWALVFGSICFSLHARSTGITWLEIIHLLLAGIRRVSNLLTIFLLIGMLTGIWRVSGTIPFLIDKALALIDPIFFILWTFLLCAGLSTLIGTSFGTVSTLGVICMLMARTEGFDETLVGGAILSGVYVGDRCSPMSSSAALVSAITRTDIYDNIRNMFRTCLVPLVLTCAAYAFLSLKLPGPDTASSTMSLLSRHFHYSFWVLLPALVVLLLGILRVNVKIAMIVSILLAMPSGMLVQHAPLSVIASSMFFGYVSPIPELDLLNGGGVFSMAGVIGIVMISSSYSLLIERSRLLEDFGEAIAALAQRLGSYSAIVITSAGTAGLACNQTLAILLTQQLCTHIQPDSRRMALYLEDSVVLISALLPWNIAFSIVALTLQQGREIIPFAVYLWLLPLYWFVRRLIAHRHALAKNLRQA